MLLVVTPDAFSDESEELAKKTADPTASLMTFNLRYTAIPSFYGIGGSAGISQFQAVILNRPGFTGDLRV